MINSKRDNSIDFFRGIAAISIILIHTAFWSGESYLNNYIKSLFLLIDVPIFIFISGMSFNYSNNLFKTIKNLVKLWYKYIVFIIIYFIIILIFDNDNFNIYEIIPALFFKFKEPNILPVVSGSIWFMPMFFSVSIIASLIIVLFNKYIKNLNEFKYIIIINFILYGISYYLEESTIPNSYTLIAKNYQLITKYLLFYILIYNLGYYFYNYKIKNFINYFAIVIILFITIISIFKLSNINLNLMQIYKFEASMIYLIYSIFSMITVIYLKDIIMNYKSNFINIIGKNAIILYFIQGISSSLIYKIYPFILNKHWIIKFIIMATVNISLALIMLIIYLYLKKLFFILKEKLISIKK